MSKKAVLPGSFLSDHPKFSLEIMLNLVLSMGNLDGNFWEFL